jgi:hypothetical protein
MHSFRSTIEAFECHRVDSQCPSRAFSPGQLNRSLSEVNFLWKKIKFYLGIKSEKSAALVTITITMNDGLVTTTT